MKRKGLSDKVRFEVFKRDSFKCQYCGATAPEVVLVVDHIHPVAKGGANDLMNLITACDTCNSGKRARTLDDNSVIERQRKQLEELNERRAQLEMLLAWRNQLDSIDASSEAALIERIYRFAPGYQLNDNGRVSVRKWLKSYALADLLAAVDLSANQYLVQGDDGATTQTSWETFFSKIPRIVEIEKATKDEPYLKDLFYVRAVLKNRCNWYWTAQRDCMPLLKRAIKAGVEPYELKDLAKSISSWGRFAEILESWIADADHAASMGDDKTEPE